MSQARKCRDGFIQADAFAACVDCYTLLRCNTAIRCRSCWRRHYRAHHCHACKGPKQPSRELCGSCVADYTAWRQAWKAVAPSGKRPPGDRFPAGHLAKLRERAAKKLPLFGGGTSERTITIRVVVEETMAKWG